MKIFISHSSGFDYLNKLYKPLSESIINRDHEIFLPHEDGKDVLTKDVIKNSDVVIAEVSFPSTGQGVELGWANVFNVPIISIHQKNAKLSGSLKYLTENFVTYENGDELVDRLIDVLDKLSSSS